MIEVCDFSIAAAFPQLYINEKDLKGKIVLLDFWFTKCGVCFEKFPQVQQAYDKYARDSSVMILAANTPIDEDQPNQAFETIRREGYSFPVVISVDKNMADRLGIKSYPTTLVLSPSGTIVYKGDIAGARSIVDDLRKNLR